MHFFFGLTGTPINRIDKNTFATFGASEDRSGYMSKYSFSDSIRDHATLPLNFEPVPVDLRVDRDTMDREFDVLTEGLSDADKAELSKRVNMQAIMYNDARIHKGVCSYCKALYRKGSSEWIQGASGCLRPPLLYQVQEGAGQTSRRKMLHNCNGH
jgi:type I restriction enzyme R subunit